MQQHSSFMCVAVAIQASLFDLNPPAPGFLREASTPLHAIRRTRKPCDSNITILGELAWLAWVNSASVCPPTTLESTQEVAELINVMVGQDIALFHKLLRSLLPVAAVNFLVRHTQHLHSQNEISVHHLTYDHQHDSWRLVFAVLPGNSPVFYNITWRRAADQSWKVANTPRWDALWKYLMSSTKEGSSTSAFTPLVCSCRVWQLTFGNRPNTASVSTVSNTQLNEFFRLRRVPGRELSEFLSAYYLRDKANSPRFFAELTEFAPRLSEAQ